ncbi:MAG: hypothetical protein KDI37_17325 [Xanthomonadales bacterium]|nr:hypothetical protein [Xanthomonadales bacterium]MCB1602588.1 hypothetical protein [Xanthomonadales bacterium]MCB1634352.1 hypothetical protein [Xanthomonadales bacterium]MCB1643495.1 hypothetical protein [Xanthomonadales bacterium]
MTLDAPRFRELIGQEFRLSVAHQPRLQLSEVRDLTGDTVRDDRQPFSLLFLEPGAGVDQALPQQIYTMHNDDIGDFELFLVCLGPDLRAENRPLVYEAIFT